MADVRVRLPLGASIEFEEATPSNATDPSRPCGAVGAHHSVKVEARVQFPSRALRHGTPTGRATKLKPWRVWVRLPPVLLECVGRRWDAGWPVTPPHSARQVRFLTGALVFGPFVYRQDTGFSAREAGFDSPTDCSGAAPTGPWTGDVAQLAEAAVSEAARCGFDSHRHHCWMSARCANRHSGQVESLMVVGSTPTLVTAEWTGE